MANPKDDPTFDQNSGLNRLLEIMRRLRDPEHGCAWDIEQDFASIAPYTIEEAYEVADAIERGAWSELEGELGDLLLQVVFHGQMGHEAGLFDFDSIARKVGDKMIARHPHIFGDESRDKTAAQQIRDWENIKEAERAREGGTSGALDGVALGLPALLRAHKLQKRAARVGFDWPDVAPVLDKVAEEAAELVEAHEQMMQAQVEEEMGDLLFAMVNLARHLGVEPEAALRRANAKFERRFKGVEDALDANGRRIQEASLEEMEALWQLQKQGERRSQNT